MTHKSWFILLALVVSPLAVAQSDKTPAEPSGEVVYDQYRVHQSVELGYRAGDTTGSEAMFDTLVNEHDGPRLLDQMFSMQSIDRQGTLFDDLFVNSVGWGGDPNNYLRMHVDKDHWYDFRASFRRDQNVFDYNLLANPLNPSDLIAQRASRRLPARIPDAPPHERLRSHPASAFHRQFSPWLLP